MDLSKSAIEAYLDANHQSVPTKKKYNQFFSKWIPKAANGSATIAEMIEKISEGDVKDGWNAERRYRCMYLAKKLLDFQQVKLTDVEQEMFSKSIKELGEFRKTA